MRVRQVVPGPLRERVYFGDREFEAIADDLRYRAGDEHFREGRGVDVDLVLEKVLDATPDYDELPPGVMGQTSFRGGKALVQMSRELAEEAEHDTVARRRLRTTGAHEAGHIVCHGPQLMVDRKTLELFNVEEEEHPIILCREGGIGVPRNYRGEWWEYQANRVMAALLLPKDILKHYVPLVTVELGAQHLSAAVKAGRGMDAIRRLTEIFDVSQQAVFYRLQDLKILPAESQMDLELEAE